VRVGAGRDPSARSVEDELARAGPAAAGRGETSSRSRAATSPPRGRLHRRRRFAGLYGRPSAIAANFALWMRAARSRRPRERSSGVSSCERSLQRFVVSIARACAGESGSAGPLCWVASSSSRREHAPRAVRPAPVPASGHLLESRGTSGERTSSSRRSHARSCASVRFAGDRGASAPPCG
jgi:hypothetical protein